MGYYIDGQNTFLKARRCLANLLTFALFLYLPERFYEVRHERHKFPSQIIR